MHQSKEIDLTYTLIYACTALSEFQFLKDERAKMFDLLSNQFISYYSLFIVEKPIPFDKLKILIQEQVRLRSSPDARNL